MVKKHSFMYRKHRFRQKFSIVRSKPGEKFDIILLNGLPLDRFKTP